MAEHITRRGRRRRVRVVPFRIDSRTEKVVLLDALERMDDEVETPARTALITSMIVRLEDYESRIFTARSLAEANLIFEALYATPSEPAVDALVLRIIDSVENPHKLLSAGYLRDNLAVIIG